MRILKQFYCLAIFTAASQLWAQDAAPRIQLQQLVGVLANAEISEEILKGSLLPGIENVGIAFSLDQQALEQILAASVRGKRRETLVSHVIISVLEACEDCRSRYFGPLSIDSLQRLVRNESIFPELKEQEVRLRGTKDIPKTTDTIRELQASGASAGLIDLVVPFDEVAIPAPEGYQPLAIARGADYDRHREGGRVDLSIEVLGRVELLFVNNSLFYRTVPSTDKKAPAPKFEFNASTNNAPAPASPMQATLDSWQRSEDKGKITKLWDDGRQVAKKTDRPPTIEFRPEAVPGHSGFYIMIDESDRKQAHTHDIRITWAKQSPAPAKPSLLK